MILRVVVLSIKCITRVGTALHIPLIESINFVQSNTERCILLLEQLDRLKGLLLQTVHNIDDKHGQVTK